MFTTIAAILLIAVLVAFPFFLPLPEDFEDDEHGDF